ncbi:hypothetical protein Celaphus_00018040 [Cervus elaphus hippelaphus]|uniref:Uncharacterized protein n=1 Tax=Cervus elaphus hippelaphus TaxID=46360 RepID=A0A212C8P1_CEREH|nr:hypothetical protein Celaphus_00018040 [Cervus elaphus hippelaphus]
MRSCVQEKLKSKKACKKGKEQEEGAIEQDHIKEGLKELNREYKQLLQIQISYQLQTQEKEEDEFEAEIAANQIRQDKTQGIWIRNMHSMQSLS